MKKIILVSLLATSLLLSHLTFANAGDQQSLDQIVAVVNDDVITKTEFNHAIETIKSQLAQQNIALPAEEALNKQVLNQVINKKLQVQMAKQAGFSITDEELDKAVSAIAKQNHMPVDALYKRINDEGMKTDDYRTELRDQLAMQKLQQQEITGKVTVTPQEITAYMNSHPLQMDGSKEYRIEDILIPLADTPSPTDIQTAKARADGVMKRLKNGEDFAKMAQVESSDKNALQGGDLGFRQLPEIPSAFAEVVSNMKPNTIAGPIQTPNGFHIIRLAGVRTAASKSAAPSRKDIENYLLQQKFEEAVQNWVSKLRSQAFITSNTIKL